MRLVDEFKQESEIQSGNQDAITYEIIEYFKERLRNGDLANAIRRYLDDKSKTDRKLTFSIGFWEYMSGCTTTNFHIASLYWYNPDNKEGYASHKYKGQELVDFHRVVCENLIYITETYLKEEGFKVSHWDDTKPHLGYKTEEFVIRW